MNIRLGLKRLSELTPQEIGTSEENVKQKVVVPLLELLGHNKNDLDFEYGSQGKRIDIFIKDLPQDCKIFIDTKKYNEDLSNHIEQIGLYAFQEGAILAIIANGEELRIYDPFFRGNSLKDALLYSIKRKEFGSAKSITILNSLLHKKNIVNKSIKQFIAKREMEIIEAREKIESIKNETQKRINELQNDIKNLSLEIDKLKDAEQEKIEYIKGRYQIYQEKTENIHKIRPSEMQEYRSRNVFSKSTDGIEIVLNKISTPKKYSLIPLSKEYRHLFPGYNVEFEMETDVGLIHTHVTSAPKGTEPGNPVEGKYILGLKKWYNAHPELKDGSTLIISVIEPQKRYSLSIR